jgi:hypothetical protein
MARRHEPRPQDLSLAEALFITELSKRDFRKHSGRYVENGQTALAPLSVVRIAHGAYQANAGKRFFPSLERVAGLVIGHVVERNPDAVPEVYAEITDFVAAVKPRNTVQANHEPTPHVVPGQIEQAYLGGALNDLQ